MCSTCWDQSGVSLTFQAGLQCESWTRRGWMYRGPKDQHNPRLLRRSEEAIWHQSPSPFYMAQSSLLVTTLTIILSPIWDRTISSLISGPCSEIIRQGISSAMWFNTSFQNRKENHLDRPTTSCGFVTKTAQGPSTIHTRSHQLDLFTWGTSHNNNNKKTIKRLLLIL